MIFLVDDPNTDDILLIAYYATYHYGGEILDGRQSTRGMGVQVHPEEFLSPASRFHSDSGDLPQTRHVLPGIKRIS